MAGYGNGTPPTSGASTGVASGLRGRMGITISKTATIAYTATGSNSTKVMEFNRASNVDSDDATATTVNETDPKSLSISNAGNTPVVVMLGYEGYTSKTADSNVVYVHSLLLPGQVMSPALRSIISLQGSNNDATNASFGDRGLWNLDGTALDWTAPGTTLKLDSGADVKNNELNNTTDPVSFGVGLPAHSKLFRVGDILRIENEILEVLGTSEDDPTGSSLDTGDIRCKRGMYGSTNASHSGTPNVDFPYFNMHHEFDKYASAGYAQTDEKGYYSIRNFFGLGRNVSDAPMGIVPGSVCLRFYSRGYQELGLQSITSSTNTGLTASTNYAFDIQVDGGTNFDNLTFTTDSSNLNFGGTNGVISKIQAAIDVQYYTAGSNLFEKKVTVNIVNGDIRFTSHSNLSTSAIALTAEDGSDDSFFGTGRIPAIGNIETAIPAMLPEGKDLVTYDSVTYAKSKRRGVLAYDQGNGTITGTATGTLDYETGTLSIVGPPNANFEYSVIYNSPFSGKRDAQEAARANSLVSIYANVLNKHQDGTLTVRGS
tara:strand:- start:258 stop:1886 length:1629 start_codon:yes stop_codon:yes gene_type:complete